MADARPQLHQALRRSPGVVLQACPSLGVLQAVQDLVGEVAARGANVLLLSDATTQSQREMLQAQWTVFLAQAQRAEPFHHGAAHLCSVDSFNAMLRDAEVAPWVDRIGLILVPQGEQVLARPYAWELMAYALRDRFAARRLRQLPRCLVIVGRRRAPESALRDALPLYANIEDAERSAWTEFSALQPDPGRLWWTIWTSQRSRDYLDGLQPHGVQRVPAGVAAPLAQFAGRWGIAAADNLLPYPPDSGEKDHVQALQGVLGRELFTSAPATPWASLPRLAQLIGAVTVAEDQGNPWRLLRNLAHACGGSVLCNLVMRSALLLDYQLAHAGSFAHAPLEPLSPMVAREVPFDTAIQLVQRVHLAGQLPLEVVRDALAATSHPLQRQDQALVDAFGALVRLVHDELSPTLADRLRLVQTPVWQPDAGRFDAEPQVLLVPSELHDAGVPWLDIYEVIGEGGNVFHTLRRDHVPQTFWRGKRVAFEGSMYAVDKVDHATRHVRVSPDDSDVMPDYRPQRRVQITTPRNDWVRTLESRREQLANGDTLHCEAFRLDFSVHGDDVVVSRDHWAGQPTIEPMPDCARRYRSGRAVRLSFTGADGQPCLSPCAAVALAAWLNEAAVTLLPEVAAFVLAAPEVSPTDRPMDPIARRVVPELGMTDQPLAEEGSAGAVQPSSPPGPAVWVFEDSNGDLGITRAVVDGRWYLLDICHDWLSWVVAENSSTPPDARQCLMGGPNPAPDWLAYGRPERDAAIGLESLLALLDRHVAQYQEVGPRRRRPGPPLLSGATEAMACQCDFCGCLMEGDTPRHTLDDGRISCAPCEAVGVNRAALLETLMRDVALPYFQRAHGIDSFGQTRVELVDQRQLAEATGRRFIPTSGYDRRSVGLAMAGQLRAASATEDEGTGQHHVLIESGFSPEATACTLVHELCHVWQFIHLDFHRLGQDHDGYLIEGHATWTEDHFLHHQHAEPSPAFDSARLDAARRGLEAQKNRADAYGAGYRLLASRLGVFNGSAFAWLRRHYPRR